MLFFPLSLTDIDNNGFLDSNDFECMALRATIIEGKGDCNPAKLSEYQHIMRSLWDEISDLADFDKVNVLRALGAFRAMHMCVCVSLIICTISSLQSFYFI